MASYDSDKVAHIHEELHSHLPPEPALRVKNSPTGGTWTGPPVTRAPTHVSKISRTSFLAH